MEEMKNKNVFIRNLQILFVAFLMMAGFKAGINNTKVWAEDDVIFYVDSGEGLKEVTDVNEIEGLSLDIEDGDYVLTLNGYNGGSINVKNTNEVRLYLDVKVVGNNSISAKGKDPYILYFDNLVVSFVGSGTLNLDMGGKHSFETHKSNLAINGPTINVLNSYGIEVEKGSFYMNSGSFNIERTPLITKKSDGKDKLWYSCSIYAAYFEIDGGKINIDYIIPEGYENAEVTYDTYSVIFTDGDTVINGGDINVTVPKALEGLPKTKYDECIVFSFAIEDEYEYWSGRSFILPSDIKGVSWDRENKVLTFDGYDGGDIYIAKISGDGCSDIKVVVKGENTFHSLGDNPNVIYGFYINLNFTGDGILNFIIDKEEYDAAIFAVGDIVIDGPTINVNSRDYYMSGAAIYGEKVTIKSGYIYLVLKPSSSGTWGGALYTYLGDLTISGGTIVIEYVDAKEGASSLGYNRPTISVPGRVNGKIDIDNCVIVFIGSDTAINAGKQFGLKENDDEEAERIKIGKNAIIKYATSFDTLEKIDISNYKASLSETVFEYDGKAKTPKVNVEGLVENVCYTVTYENNVEAGMASAIIKGTGVYTGTIKLDFTINKANESDKVKEDVPKAGTTIKDKKYIYKVTKAGSKDGSIVGELEVIGLKKKSLTQIKIAAVVKIDGVSYKVTSVGAKAFKGNKKITKAIIGKNVVKIGASAFANCKKLKQVSINSKKLKRIGKNAFAGDKKLKKVIIKSTKLKKIGKKAFLRKGGKKLTVKVSKSKKKVYKKLLKEAKTNKFVVK